MGYHFITFWEGGQKFWRADFVDKYIIDIPTMNQTFHPLSILTHPPHQWSCLLPTAHSPPPHFLSQHRFQQHLHPKELKQSRYRSRGRGMRRRGEEERRLWTGWRKGGEEESLLKYTKQRLASNGTYVATISCLTILMRWGVGLMKRRSVQLLMAQQEQYAALISNCLHTGLMKCCSSASGNWNVTGTHASSYGLITTTSATLILGSYLLLSYLTPSAIGHLNTASTLTSLVASSTAISYCFIQSHPNKNPAGQTLDNLQLHQQPKHLRQPHIPIDYDIG